MSLRALLVCPLWVVILTASLALPQTDESSPAPPTETPPAPTPAASSGPSAEDAKKQAKTATDAANKVESAIAAAREPRVRVERYLADITRIIGAEPKPSSSPLDDLRSIDAAVAALQEPTPDLIQRLANVKEALGSAEAARATPCDLSTFKDAAPEVEVAQGKCSDAQKHAADETSKLDAAITGIRKALGDLYPYAAKQVTAMAERLGPLQSLQPGDASPAAEPLLQSLPRNLPVLRQVVTEGAEYQIRWERTKLRLEKLKITAPEGSADARANDAVQSAINSIVPKLEGWFTVLGTFAQTSAKDLDSKISEVETDPARNSSAAIEASRDKSEVVAELQSVVDAWPPMVAYLVDGKPSNFNLKTTKKNFDVLQSSLNTLRGAVSRLNDAVAGDFSQFETDQVSLYYFSDVKRLMFALNDDFHEMGGVAEAQEQAAAQRKKLSESEFELADAQASVNRYQKEVLDLQEQQRQIQATLKGQDSKVSKLASRLKHTQDARQAADNEYQAALKDQSDHPDDATKAKAVEKAKAKQDAAEAKSSQTQSDYDSAKSGRDATQSQIDASKNDSEGLPTKIEEAKQALSGAQAAVSEQRRKMLMAAQAESDAFAFARDNTPFLYAQAVGSSTNPARRVQLYAFNDSKTIFMRGKRDDLKTVKDIIAEFDRPAPQARLTLWTFELNSEANQKANVQSANRLNRSMEIVDQELGDTRALVNTTLTLLRDLINQEVSTSAFPPPGAICAACTPADLEKLSRVIGFYDPSVLTQLRFNATTPVGPLYPAYWFTPWEVDLTLLRKLIPDPAGTTTLGEALVILSLAKPDIKIRVRENFESRIQARLQALSLSPNVDKCAWLRDESSQPDSEIDCPEDSARPNPSAKLLSLTWHALGIWETGVAGPGAGLTSSELEITRALRTSYETARRRQIADRLESWYLELGQLEPRLAKLRADMANFGPAAALTPAALAKYAPLEAAAAMTQARITGILNGSVEVVKELRSYGVDIDDLVVVATSDSSSVEKINAAASALRVRVLRAPGLNAASPRVAAADQMLKEIIIALEDDLSRLFVQPMIRGLRVRLIAEGVRVGILQRESLLATNRGKARIDPRASAQLAVGEEQDILTGIQQLAQLYTAVQSGGALAALGALQSHPREPQPEIYALTTGNKFEVTPIFDPSGQALRFKFDYVSSSGLQEPNGSTNPQFPRIERHTVNTEVQLSNLETREISRFESNARLGLPTRYWGGIPVLKDIPYVRPWVPLVGWFVRKGGSNAMAQQSVIFGQTTIYPTIGSLIDLLADESGPN